jgi:hypothetical protein
MPRRASSTSSASTTDAFESAVRGAPCGSASLARYASNMETEAPARPPFLRRVLAVLILVAAAVIIIKVALGIVMTFVWIAVGLAIAVAVLWALKTIVW